MLMQVPSVVVVGFVFFGAVGLWTISRRAWKWFFEQYRQWLWEKKFKRFFGGYQPEEAAVGRCLQQIIVQVRLAELAKRLGRTVREENLLREKVAKTYFGANWNYKAWRRNKKELDVAKAEFWAAHAIAKFNGFRVEDSYKKYL